MKKFFTICSDGFHKICDIWWFEAESVEIAWFCAEKPFDFMYNTQYNSVIKEYRFYDFVDNELFRNGM